MACQSVSSKGYSIVSGINCALEILPLLHFLFVGVSPGVGGSICFCNKMTNYISHIANARDT